MKEAIDITSNVMSRIKVYEKKRIRRFRRFFVVMFLICIFFFICGIVISSDILRNQNSFDPFTLFTEDWDIIADFWQDVIAVFFMELPVPTVILSVSSIVLLGLIMVLSRNKRRKLHMVENQLMNEQVPQPELTDPDAPAPADGIQTKKSGKNYAVAAGIIAAGVLIVGGLLYARSQADMSSGNDTGMPQESEVSTGSPSSQFGQMDASGSGAPDSASQMEKANQIVLTVDSPLDNAEVTNPRLTVRGKTAPNAEVYVDTVETKANAAGAFSATLDLEEDENYIIITAIDENGSVAEKQLLITYTPAS